MSAFSVHAANTLRFLFRYVELFDKLFCRKTELVVVNKIIFSRVVGRVNVDHLHAAGIGFLQDFQGFEIFGLDKHVVRTVEIYRFFPAGGQGIGSGTLQIEIGGCFARPIELIAFARVSKIVRTEDKFEFFKVNFLFAKDFGEEGF